MRSQVALRVNPSRPAVNVDPETLVGRCECGGDPANSSPGVVCSPGQTCLVAFDGGQAACAQD